MTNLELYIKKCFTKTDANWIGIDEDREVYSYKNKPTYKRTSKFLCSCWVVGDNLEIYEDTFSDLYKEVDFDPKILYFRGDFV